MMCPFHLRAAPVTDVCVGSSEPLHWVKRSCNAKHIEQMVLFIQDVELILLCSPGVHPPIGAVGANNQTSFKINLNTFLNGII